MWYFYFYLSKLFEYFLYHRPQKQVVSTVLKYSLEVPALY